MGEYGGYLSLESRNEEYYKERNDYTLVRLNAARYAIIEAFRCAEVSKLWIPVYMCRSVYDALDKAGIPYGTYNISAQFLPEIDAIGDNEAILVTNYFGIFGEKYYKTILKRYKVVFFDFTQAFFETPMVHDSIYTVYSPRKFFGVTDGAYLIAPKNKYTRKYQIDESHLRSNYLLKSVECGTNEAYKGYLACEDEITQSGIKEMSLLTRNFLGNLDYEYAKKRRRKNYLLMNEVLKEDNALSQEVLQLNDNVPMVYPFLLKGTDDKVREYYIQNKLYVPQWWKWVLECPAANEFEKYLSKNLIPLPIDQRYDDKNIEDILAIVKGGIHGWK